jgi:hypothetical protein
MLWSCLTQERPKGICPNTVKGAAPKPGALTLKSNGAVREKTHMTVSSEAPTPEDAG